MTTYFTCPELHMQAHLWHTNICVVLCFGCLIQNSKLKKKQTFFITQGHSQLEVSYQYKFFFWGGGLYLDLEFPGF